MKVPRITRSGTLIGFYSAFGGFLYLFSQWVWAEGALELELIEAYPLSLSEAILWGLCSFMVAVPISINISLALERVRRKQKDMKIFTTCAINVVMTYLSYMIIFILAFRTTNLSAEMIIFTFANIIVIAFSTYLVLSLPSRGKLKSFKSTFQLEALKLEHEWILRVVNILTWVVMIALASAWFASFYQYVSHIPFEKWSTIGFMKLGAAHAMRLVYLCVGFWLGVLAPLLDRSLRIHEEIRELS